MNKGLMMIVYPISDAMDKVLDSDFGIPPCGCLISSSFWILLNFSRSSPASMESASPFLLFLWRDPGSLTLTSGQQYPGGVKILLTVNPSRQNLEMNKDKDITPNPTTDGLIISNTETIASFLTSAADDTRLSESLHETASALFEQPTEAYKSLRSIWCASESLSRPHFKKLLSQSKFVFTSPKPREKSEELKVRLRKLEEAAERNAYQELVKDIAPKREIDEPFSSYKDQLGFGLHVVVTMFTGYLVGYATFRALFGHSPVMNAAGGIFGLVCAMLVETLLFIIRDSEQDRRSISFTSKLKKNQ